MSAAGREAAPYFSQPVRQGAMMLAVLGLVAAGLSVAAPRVAPVFLANPWLNGFIGLVFVIGVLACFWQVVQVIGSVRWVVAFTSGRPGTDRRAPRLLAPLASLLRERGAGRRIGSASARSILDSVATRIDEARDITRYIVNLLIFLGLLGTFYGLATTVPAVVDTIRSLAPQEGEGSLAVFDRLMTGLEAQLGGMGVAFSSSLLGLAGSLVVGLLELFAGHGQNRFYRELEEWLSTITRVGFAAEEGAEPGSGAMPALVDELAERLDDMQRLFAEAEVGRGVTDRRLGALADAVEGLTDRLARGSAAEAALARVAEGQGRLVALLEESGAAGGLDAESRMRLRSIDVQMLRLLEEVSAGREESMAELRTDIAALARALRPGGPAHGSPALGPAPQPVPPIRRGGQGAS